MDAGEGESVTSREDLDEYIEFWTRMLVAGLIIIPMLTMIVYYILT